MSTAHGFPPLHGRILLRPVFLFFLLGAPGLTSQNSPLPVLETEVLSLISKNSAFVGRKRRGTQQVKQQVERKQGLGKDRPGFEPSSASVHLWRFTFPTLSFLDCETENSYSMNRAAGEELKHSPAIWSWLYVSFGCNDTCRQVIEWEERSPSIPQDPFAIHP